MRKQIKLLEYHPHLLSDYIDIYLRRIDLLVIHIDFTFRHILQQVQATQKCAFTRAGRADDDNHLSLRDMLVYPV